MNVKLIVQKKDVNTLQENFFANANKDLKKLYVLIGGLKESGYDVLEELLIDLKARKLILLGIDKKYTTKRMLEGLYKYTKNIFLYNNNGQSELATNIFIFEYETRSEIYLLSGNFSDNLVSEDKVIYTHLTYNLKDAKDKSSYSEYIDTILQELKQEEYKKLSKEYIGFLSQSKEIFTTKQYVHNVMSISELLEKSEKEITDAKGEKKISSEDKVNIPKFDLNEIDSVNIDIEEELKKENIRDTEILEKIEVKKIKVTKKSKKENEKAEQVEEHEIKDTSFNANDVLNIEDMLFEKADIRLDKKNVDKLLKENKKKKEKSEGNKVSGSGLNKKIDLEKVSNIVMEMKAKPSKGKELTAIKVPNQIRKLIPSFFYTGTEGISIKKIDGQYKESNIILEIIDIRSNKKLKDMDAQISFKSGQTHISFVSEKLKEVEYLEGDIARIIKLSNDTYHIEIVPKDIEEYNLWKKMCNQTVSGSNRQFGVM